MKSYHKYCRIKYTELIKHKIAYIRKRKFKLPVIYSNNIVSKA